MRRHLPPLVAAALSATFSSVSPAAASTEVDGASIRTWNEIAVTTIVSTTPPTPGPVGPLYLAYVHRAVYDAVRDLPHHASVPAAVAAAAHGVLVNYFPDQRGTLDERYAAELAAVPDGEAEDEGVAAGAEAAQTLIEVRRDDGLNGPAPAPADPRPRGVAAPPDGATDDVRRGLLAGHGGALRPRVPVGAAAGRPACAHQRPLGP
jgi:hypothetical protein